MINKDCKETCICKECIINISNNLKKCKGCDWCLEEGSYFDPDDKSTCSKFISINHLKFKKWIKGEL